MEYSFQIPGVTTHLAVQGVYTVDYFLIFCVRYGSVYKLKRDVSEPKCLTNLSSLPVDLALDFNRFVTVNMDSTFQSYTLKVTLFHSVYRIFVYIECTSESYHPFLLKLYDQCLIGK